MVCPLMLPWVKQRCQRPRVWIKPSQIARFFEITIRARQRKIIEILTASVLSWDDVFDVMRYQRRA